MINIEKIKPTGLFTNYIYKAIPLAFDESMSYYETLCGLLSYLKDTVIPTLNNNADAIIEVQNLMQELQNYVDNYFNNLDVQNEINNKLDQMASDGTLQEIIANYLNVKAVFGFDNVEQMKNATNLLNGSYAKTLGFYNINDKGNALYKIRTITNDDVVDNMTIIALNNDNSLIAELITNNPINPEMFGAKGDGITNDTSIIKKVISYAKQNNLKIFLQNKYLINEPIKIDYAIDLDGIYDNAGFIQSLPSNDVLVIDRPFKIDIRGLSIKNIVLSWSSLPTENTCGLRIQQTSENKDGWGIHESIFERIKILNPYVGIINEKNEPSWNVDLKSIRINNAQFQVANLNMGFGINAEIIAIGNSNNANVTRGIGLNANFGGTLYYDIEDWQGKIMKCDNGFFALHVTHIHMERCTFNFTYTGIISTSVTSIIFDTIEIYDCTFGGANAYTYLISVYGTSETSNACIEVKKVVQSNNKIPDTIHFVVIGTVNAVQRCIVWFVGGFPEIYFPSGASLNRCYFAFNPMA